MNTEADRSPLEPGAPPAGPGRLPLLVAALLGLAVLAAAYWLLGPGASSPPPPPLAQLPPLNEEAEAYLPQIEFSRLEFSRWQNFLGQEVTYLDGSVRNHGPRTVVALEVRVEFLDGRGNVVLSETFRAIGARPAARTQRLASGQAASFRAGFEEIPAEWDGGLPRLRVTGLLLE